MSSHRSRKTGAAGTVCETMCHEGSRRMVVSALTVTCRGASLTPHEATTWQLGKKGMGSPIGAPTQASAVMARVDSTWMPPPRGSKRKGARCTR